MAFMTFDTQRLFYQIIDGDSNKPWLVFLHEGLGCTAMWQDFPQQLCQQTGCPGLVYDRLGYGQSSPANSTRSIHYLHDYALNELPKVLNAVIPETPYIVVGHSDGGSIALLHAAEQPEYLIGAVTKAAHIFIEPETLDGIRAAVSAYQKGKLDGLADFHGDKTAQVFSSWADIWLSPAFKYWNMEYALPSIECPLLVIQGEEDQYGSIDQVTGIVEGSTGPATALMVKDCGHSPHLDQANVVATAIADFLTKI